MLNPRTDHCTWFPDHVKIRIRKLNISYDISLFCKVHDEMYLDQHTNRLTADLVLYGMCAKAYPQYDELWIAVYSSVRTFGWIFWHWQRLTKAYYRWRDDR